MKCGSSAASIVALLLIVSSMAAAAAASTDGSGMTDRLESGCLKPEAPENGEMFLLWSGLLIQFRCRGPEFRLVGAAAVICRNRTWTQEPPVCQRPTDHHQPAAASTGGAGMKGAEDMKQQSSPKQLTAMASDEDSSSTKKKNKNGNGSKQASNKNKNKDKKTQPTTSTAAPLAAEKTKKGNKNNSNNNNNKQGNNKTTNPPGGEAVTLSQHQRNLNSVVGNKTTDDSSMDEFLATLDQSCLIAEGNEPLTAAPLVPHTSPTIKYIKKRNKSPTGGNRYAAAVYQCASGYSMSPADNDRLYCRQGRWIGPTPSCIAPHRTHQQEGGEDGDEGDGEEEANNALHQSDVCGEDKAGCEHICDDTTGRPKCLCYRGYTLADDATTCTDVDECAVDNGGCEGLCVNRQGSFQCSCSEGFRLASNGKKCIDHNECLLRNGHGPCQGSCRNTHGSYECGCEERPGTQLAADGHSCQDLDECNQFGDNFGCSHTCLNTLGTAFCTCPDGYMLGDDWKTCQDIDECELEDVGQSCAGTCINTIGSFRCSEEDTEDDDEDIIEETGDDEQEEVEIKISSSTAVAPVTTESPTRPPVTTEQEPADYEDEPDEPEEDDESTTTTTTPVPTTTTMMTTTTTTEEPHGEEEECPEGFLPSDDDLINSEDGSHCHDVDECLLPGDQHNYGCSHQCVNTPGSAYCTCPDGYIIGDDRKTCQDINECSSDGTNFGCSDQCINTVGSAYCQCSVKGYALANDSKTCADIDECLEANFGCAHQCVNLPGSAECRCQSGFKLKSDQKTCKDIDECAKENGGCSHQCNNLKGSMKCSCPDGYQLTEDDKTCTDVDECLDETSESFLRCSSSGGSCVNIAGSYRCDCPDGYVTNSTTNHCVDVDECAQDSPCSAGCTNLPGSYRCECDPGFVSGENGTCTDIDECPEGVCDQLCTNLPGSYVCDCHIGYQLIGDVCQDVDECSGASQDEQVSSAPPCDGICRNTVGSFECLCADGFRLENDKCVDIDECDSIDPCSTGGVCTNSPGSYSCSCQIGYQMSDNGTCIDVDECLAQESPCPVECINTPGSFTCLCPTGYRFVDNICIDVDECLNDDASPCGASSKCINNEGSFTCECESGYLLKGQECEDVDECKENRCNGGCINLPGSYQCICDPGYELRNGRCEDIDECANYKCGGRCVNLPGTYVCECDKGYKLEGDKCVDIDECRIKPCQGTCYNLPGTYRCECPAGFKSERHDCADVDECSQSNGGCAHICINTNGSFYCECSPGYETNNRNSSQCTDVNECRLNNGGCSQDCINSRGSYHCTCSDQYYLESDGRTCVERPPRCPKMSPPDNGDMECNQNMNVLNDLYAAELDDEAVPAETGRGDIGASGWAASRVALSSSGRHGKRRPFYNSGSTCIIRCHKGFKLVGDLAISCDRTGHWIGEPATCIPLACPKLQAPDNGVLVPHTCGTGKTFGGQQCQVKCKTGYRLIGGATPYVCLATSQTWRSPDEPPRCERVDSPVPFIQCPGNMAVNLPPQERFAYVTFSQPKSNMDWFRYVDSDPVWAKQLAGELSVGLNTIKFRVRSPVTDLTASCSFTIEVFDKELPRVTNCPTSLTVYLEPGQSSQIVTWNEPIFTDNIQVVQLNKSKEPGELFQAGYHEVIYTGQDAAGNLAKCQFTIHVTSLSFAKDNASPITKLPRGRVLVRCPGSKPGKYVEMYTYKVPTGCIVVNNPSVFPRSGATTPRYTVFDWDFVGSGSSGSTNSDTLLPINNGEPLVARNNRLTADGLPRLRDAGAPSAPVIVPGPSWNPSMGTPLRGRTPKTRVPSGGALHHQSFWRCCQSMDNRLVMNKPQFQQLPEYNQIIPAYWSYYWEDPVDGAAEAIIKQAPNSGNNKRNNKKRGGAVDLLLPFTQSGTIDEQDGTAANAVITRPSGRKRQQPGPKLNPKPGPSFVPTSHDHSSSSSVRSKVNNSNKNKNDRRSNKSPTNDAETNYF